MKAKLEATLDEAEDALEREKKARLEQERNKRRSEAEVKSMQAALDALQRSKKEVETATTRKEKEISALTDKLNNEQTNLSKANKQIKFWFATTFLVLFPSRLLHFLTEAKLFNKL